MANEFDQGSCPVCNGNKLLYKKRDEDGEWLSQAYICKDCGFKGYEWFNIVFSHHSTQDEKEINEYKEKLILKECDSCLKEITRYEYKKNKGLCNDCVESIN
jgi:predicted RNA-binding Zn-ribbon protein involved in translation (DUF1610 family)